MLNKKMLLSVLVLGFVATVAGAGTFAYFNDVQTVEDNTITAGTLEMSATGTDSETAFDNFEIGPLKPGQEGSIKDFNIVNTGTLPGELTVTVTPTVPEGSTIGENLHLYINDVEASTYTYDLAASEAGTGDEKNIKITYAYDNDETLDANGEATQNSEQGDIVSYDIKYELKQITSVTTPVTP